MSTQRKLYGILALTAVLGLATAIVTATSLTFAGGSDRPASRAPSATPQVCGTLDGLGCAPESARVDLFEPAFSDPTNVTNPFFPISDLHSAVLLGRVDGLPFRTETTLLPETKVIKWNGKDVETLVSQYVAYLDGRIHEVALDYYAQADDGSVWYFGEDVFNYEDGEVADTDGTWLAGVDGPAAMIMPSNPQVGDAYRPENAPGIVFEEVTVTAIGLTVNGPRGPVAGAITVNELHMDGTREDKIFAPGYGEFSTGNPGGDLEAIALAVPTDALPGPAPAELDTLQSGADDVFGAAEAEDWNTASAALSSMTPAWTAYQAGGVPPMLDTQMSDAIDALAAAIVARDSAKTRGAAIHVARAVFDFQLRHQPVVEIDLARFELWARQTLVDAGEEDATAVKGDSDTLEWIADRFDHTLERADAMSLEKTLAALERAARKTNFDTAAEAAEGLLDLLAELEPAS